MAKTTGDGIPIPDVIDPPESMQMTLCIPKNRDHMAAFFGALYQLTVWQSWQEDAAHNGTLVAQVWWRYFLSWNRSMNDLDCEDGMAKCCVPNPELKRIDPETERPQISYDNGATWQQSPDDTQNQITLLPPIVRSGSPSTKCDAATNAIQHINELITATGENLTTASDVFTLALAVAEALLALFLIIISAGTLTAPVVAVATAIWAAATGVFALGIDGYNAYWTTDKQDLIFCKIVCNIGENGQFTEAQYQTFRAEIKAALPASPAFDIIMTAINVGGAVGLSQMASYGSWATADCASCACGDCDLDLWTVQYGTIVTRDAGHITASATIEGDGFYYFIAYSPSAEYCCSWTVEDIDPLAQNLNEVRACGLNPALIAANSDGLNNVNNSATILDVVAYKTRSSSPFTVTMRL
jgi:hypothetical protein